MPASAFRLNDPSVLVVVPVVVPSMMMLTPMSGVPFLSETRPVMAFVFAGTGGCLCCGAQGEDDLPVAQRIADVRSGEQPVENLTNGLVFGPECHFAGDVYQGLVVEKTVFTLPFDAGHGLFERDVAHVECDPAVLRIGSGAEQQPPEQQCETAQRTAEDRNVPSVPEVCHLICFHKWLL